MDDNHLCLDGGGHFHCVHMFLRKVDGLGVMDEIAGGECIPLEDGITFWLRLTLTHSPMIHFCFLEIREVHPIIRDV